MPDLATLEALRDAFWPLYVTAITLGAVSFMLTRRWCLGRTVFALVTGSLAQWAWEGSGYLLWWQHLAIDVPVFILVTMPPRHYWQSVMGALVFAQIVLHCVWGGAINLLDNVPDLAREHWLGVLLIGYAKCLLLLLWAGGRSVERSLGLIAERASRMVLATPLGRLVK